MWRCHICPIIFSFNFFFPFSTHRSSSLFLVTVKCDTVSMRHHLSNHFPTDGYLSYFQCFPIVTVTCNLHMIYREEGRGHLSVEEGPCLSGQCLYKYVPWTCNIAWKLVKSAYFWAPPPEFFIQKRMGGSWCSLFQQVLLLRILRCNKNCCSKSL